MITPDFRVDNIASLWDFRVFNGDYSTYILSPGGQRSKENHNRDSQKLKIQASIHYQKYLFHNTSLTSKAMPPTCTHLRSIKINSYIINKLQFYFLSFTALRGDF